jgi:hypothetical protein
MHMKKWTAAAIGAVLAVSAAGSAVAHHSFATEFDRNKPIRLEGKVVKFEWVNPHSWIHLRTPTAPCGASKAGAPSALLAAAGTGTRCRPAPTSSSTPSARATGDTRASAAEIRFPNGRELSLGNPTDRSGRRRASRAAATEPNRSAWAANTEGLATGPRALSFRVARLRRARNNTVVLPLVAGLRGK